MTWAEALRMAKFGVGVRLPTWPGNQSLVFVWGGGTTRAVAVLRTGAVQAVLKTSDFGAAELASDQWAIA